MTDRPIIFSAPMVRALLHGRKTQTRRIIKKPAALDALAVFGANFLTLRGNVDLIGYAPGDRLYVREAHQFRGADYGDGEIEWFRCYGSSGAADNWDVDPPLGWSPSDADHVRLLTDRVEQEGDGVKGYVTRPRPSIHMPRWASRLTLTVTDVSVQRLQDICEADAKAEGVDAVTMADVPRQAAMSRRSDFAALWNSLHGASAWDANPWVAAISFEVRHGNIDQIGGAA